MSEREKLYCDVRGFVVAHQVMRVPGTQIQLPVVMPTILPKVVSSRLDPFRYKWLISNQRLNIIIEPAHII